MTTEPMTLDEMREVSPYVLAEMAQCRTPDSRSSAGAKLLDSVRDDVRRAIKEATITLDDFDDDGQLHAIADDAPSIWTVERWHQFVDLAAYHEEPEFDDAWPKDLNQAAAVALYQICERLAYALCEAWRQGWQCPTCGDGYDDGCREDECVNPAGPLLDMVAERLADLAEDTPANGPVTAAEPLPTRTRGLALGMALSADTAVYTSHVDLWVIDQVDATDMGVRVTRAAMAHDRAVSRFRRKVWGVAAVLAMAAVTVGALVAGGVL